MSKVKVNSRDVRIEERPTTFEPLLNVAEAARMIGVKTPTLYGWIESGEFEGLKLGRKAVRVRPEAIRAFIENAKKLAQGRIVQVRAA